MDSRIPHKTDLEWGPIPDEDNIDLMALHASERLHASVEQLQSDLDKYRERYRRERATSKVLRSRLKECRAKYLGLKELYDQTLGAVEERDDELDAALARAPRL